MPWMQCLHPVPALGSPWHLPSAHSVPPELFFTMSLRLLLFIPSAELRTPEVHGETVTTDFRCPHACVHSTQPHTHTHTLMCAHASHTCTHSHMHVHTVHISTHHTLTPIHSCVHVHHTQAHTHLGLMLCKHPALGQNPRYVPCALGDPAPSLLSLLQEACWR